MRAKESRYTASDSDARTDPVSSLQRTLGNQAVRGLLERERDTDGTVDAVGSTPTVDTSVPARIQRGAMGCNETALDDRRGRRVRSTTSGGKPLPDGVRESFELYFDRDLRDVRVHTGPAADEAARAVDARAFTHGRNVVFKRGKYDPNSLSGKRLLAHEVTHVLQQRGREPSLRATPSIGERRRLGHADAELEREAVLAAEGFVQSSGAGGSERAVSPTSVDVTYGRIGETPTIQRQPEGVTVGSPVVDTALEQAGAVVGAIEGRPLYASEQRLAESVFHGSVDYNRVRLATSGPTWTTSGNVIFVPEDFDIENTYHAETFIHEMAHVWQYQHGGSRYISISLGRQLAAWIGSGFESRHGAYEYEITPGASIFDYRPEQQASIVQRYFALRRERDRFVASGTSVPATLARDLGRHEPLVVELTAALPPSETELLERSVRESLMTAQPPGEGIGGSLEEPLPIRPLIRISF